MTTTPQAVSPASSNLLLGRGMLYLDRLSKVNGVWTKTGEFPLGNVTAFEITPKASQKQKFESMDAASLLYGQAFIQQQHEIKITGDEFSLFNVAAAVMGSQSLVSVTGASVTGEALTTTPQRSEEVV